MRGWGQLRTAVLVTGVQHWRKAFLPATLPEGDLELARVSPLIPQRIGVVVNLAESRISWELGLWASM